MTEIEFSQSDIELWSAMADHFLDTENRPGIAHTALLCVQAGLSVPEARDIWLREVSPVVGANLLSVAGEWAGWDERWFVERVKKRAVRRRKRPSGVLGQLLARLWINLNWGEWKSIERCMHVLAEAAPDQRVTLAADLSLLAYHYFDCAWEPPVLDEARRERLRELQSVLFSVLQPATLCGEHVPARARIAALLTPSSGIACAPPAR